jgi:UDP-N-acetylmuramoyl-L-alanyl-D-glutamate--2,6-diaminopimelate ligase
VRTAIMEVTTHAILFHRVAGIRFALGIITNLVADEHLELHPTPEHYVRTKARFFDMLLPGAPLVLNADDAAVRDLAAPLERPLVGVSMTGREGAAVLVEDFRMGAAGSAYTLRLTRALPRLGGGAVEPMALPLEQRVLGPQLAANGARAAVAALIAGVEPDAIARALAGAPPMRRRMEVVLDGGPLVIDDTVGNPASIEAVFDTAAAIAHERLIVVYGIRGSRGLPINEHNALALAARVHDVGARLVVTASEDVADERNRVTPEERDTVLALLRVADVPFLFEPTLEGAIRHALDDCGAGDLVLLLGAQGMDRAAVIARDVLGAGGRV